MRHAPAMMVFLIAWTAAAFVWWIIALTLLAWSGRNLPTKVTLQARPSITVFKPLPPTHDSREREAMADAIASFLRQLSVNDELILGVSDEDEAAWRPSLQRWLENAPAAAVKVLSRPAPAQCANPKVAWLQVMSADAKGELWLWSDADVTAPPGFLDAACAQLLEGGDQAVTAPYCIGRVERACEVLDALYVDVEFLPGALLLGRLKRKSFAYGAATLFRAGTFRQRVDWQRLGAALADDYVLGQLLQPVALTRVMVSTFTQPTGWPAAWQHYYRWQKTVRWCQPGGYAATLLILPALGWTAAALIARQPGPVLAGLGAVIGGEILVAAGACRILGCRLPARAWWGVALWPVTRAVVWLLVWLPLPAVWSGRKRAWFAPRQD